MREVFKAKCTKVVCTDATGAGGACHEYEIRDLNGDNLDTVRFQNGPIQESGVNGVQNEDLAAIIIDRLQGFQTGHFACRENAVALTKFQEGLMWLQKRTADREARNVEGKSIV